MTPTAEHYRAARAIIAAPGGWHKDGRFFKYNNQYTACACAYGALGLAKDPDYAEMWAILYKDARVLQDFLPDHWSECSVEDFNDHPDTTLEDILALFDRAIEGAEG